MNTFNERHPGIDLWSLCDMNKIERWQRAFDTQLDKEKVREALDTYWERTTKGDVFEWTPSDAMDSLKKELGL